MQWGLDAGPLQNNWNPYLLDWSDGTYEPASETEGEVSALSHPVFDINTFRLDTYIKMI